MSNKPQPMFWEMPDLTFDSFNPDSLPAGHKKLVTITGTGTGFVSSMQGVLIREGDELSSKTVVPLLELEVTKGTFEFECKVTTYLAEPGEYTVVLWYHQDKAYAATTKAAAFTVTAAD